MGVKAKPDGAAEVGDNRVKLDRNSALETDAETDKGEREARDEGAKRDGAAGVAANRVNLGRNSGLETDAETEKWEREAKDEKAKQA